MEVRRDEFVVIEYVLKGLIIATILACIQISYNTLLYRQFGVSRWIKFIIISLFSVGIGGVLIYYTKSFVQLPYVEIIVNFTDTLLFAFFGYISKWFLLIWFVLPVLSVWAVYLIKSIIYVINNRIKFRKWQKQNQETNMQEKQEMNMTETKSKEQENISDETIYFLEDVETTNIRYNTILGLQRVYELAKKKGLQLGKTERGYVAVYSNTEGVNLLSNILQDYGIETYELEKLPSVVFINKKVVKGIPIKKAMEKLKAGESIE